MQNLVDLDISCDEIEEISNHIKNLVKLEDLSIGGRKLSELPLEIGELQNLRTLNIYKCAIKKLPETILNLENLKYFFIDESVYNIITEDKNNIIDKLKDKGCDIEIESTDD